MIFAVSILLTAGVLAFVLFVRSSDLPEAVPESPVLHLEERKAIIYDNLRDLNFEYRLGKLSDADYSKTKLTLQNELASVLAGIDAILKGAPAAAPQKSAAKVDPLKCPHCGAKFDKPMKFCGECGKTIAGGEGMRLAVLLLALTPVFAAIDGTVVDKTTGKPQPGVKVSMTKMGQGGMQQAGSTVSGPDGKFKLDSDAASAHLIQAVWQGVTYNTQLAPKTPTSGIEIAVFDALTTLSAVDFTQHMILVETDGKELVVQETIIVSNDSQTTWNDPKSGTIRFTVPAAAGKAIMARVIAPGGMPVEREPKPAGPGQYMLDFPVKPGETRFDISYKFPATGDAELAGKILHAPGPVRLVVPKGMTATGDGLTPLGNEPRSQAAIFDIKGNSYKVKFTGAGTLAASQPAAGGGGEAPAEGAAAEEDGARIQQIQPPGYDRAWKYALGLMLGILILSFAALWLKPTPAARSNTKA